MLRRVLTEIQAIHELGDRVHSVESLGEVLQAVVDRIAVLLPADRVSLIAFDQKKEQVTHFFRGGPGADRINTSVRYQELQSGLSGWVLDNVKPAYSPKDRPDPRESPEVQARRKETCCGCILVVPLKHTDQVLGTITAINRPDQKNFTPTDRELLGLFANYCAITIDNTKLVLELKESKARAEEAYRAKSEFLATMSHELRTPLSSIVGYADLLAQSPLNPQQGDQVSAIQQGGEILLSVINDILDLAKMESGSLELENRPFDLRLLVRNVANLFLPKMREKSLELRVGVDPRLPLYFRGDAARLRQILINLLGNAVKFTPQGRVGLEVQGQAGPDVWDLEFRVEDTGIGISPATLEKLFQPFTQGDSSISRTFGGTGLGLAICRKLGNLMGGTIRVSSRPGEGSAFTLQLPLEAWEGDLEIRTYPTGSSAPSSLVLVVDDVQINRKVIKALLETLGHRPLLAASGAEALGLWREHRPAVILMDVAMPGMDGYETTRAIRKEEEIQGLPRVPILGISAHTLGSDRLAALEAGMDGFLFKPIRLEDMRRTLGEYLLE